MTSLHLHLTADASGHQVLNPAEPSGAYGGGSRAGFVGLVKAMGRLGTYEVTAFSTFRERSLKLDGVEYVRLDESRKHGVPDVLFAYYDGAPLHGVAGPLRIHSAHTYLPLNPGFPWPHVYTAPTQHAVDVLRQHYRRHEPWYVLPNAVEGLDGVEWNPTPGRVIYHTSADRGLHLLLEAWPEIRARVPHATLHVGGSPREAIDSGAYHGLDGTYEAHRSARLVRGLMAAQEAGGFELLGRLPRGELLRELSEAACFAFPCECSMPSETFSISVLECCTIGVPVVLAPEDALEPLYRDSGVVMTRAPADQHLLEFVDAVVDVLTNRERAAECSRGEREFATGFSFDRSARVLDSIIQRHLLKAVG